MFRLLTPGLLTGGRRFFAALLCLSGFPVPAIADGQEQPLHYDVSFPQAAAHYVSVTLTIPAVRTGSVELMMPVWTPGSYLVREYARNIDQIAALDTADRRLPIEKISKNRWRLACDPGTDVRVTWRVYCHEMSVRTNWVDRDMAVLNGAATFLTLPGDQQRVHRVRMSLPGQWTSCVTALKSVDGAASVWEAASVEELMDSPILCGQPAITSFRVGGVTHTLAHLGDSSLWDLDRVTHDVQQIVREQQEFWGVVPYDRYRFLNVISEGRGGLEHDNSTLLMTSRWNYRDPEKYQDWLSLVSHEFFHLWNVRRLRPAGLTEYDFETENYTRGLWIAEGVTTYYEDLMLVRAGLIDQKQYLKRLSKLIEQLQTTEGRNVQSLSDASFDAWIKYYRPDENSANTRISYYTKGAIVAFLLDARIRRLTDNRQSLDDVMRELFTRYAGEGGYTEANFRELVSEVTGMDFAEWFLHHVDTAVELDYQPALDWFGLRFPVAGEESSDTNDSDGEDSGSDGVTGRQGDASSPSAQKKPDPPKAWLGITVAETGSSPVITRVTANSPAHVAGLNVDDEIIAFNQYRATASAWQSQLTQLGVGETVQLMVARRGEIRTIEVVLAEEPRDKWTLLLRRDADDSTVSHLQSWLGLGEPKSGAAGP